jgi:restriction system protein
MVMIKNMSNEDEKKYQSEQYKEFIHNIRRGRKFEEWEKSHWQEGIDDGAQFEKQTQWNGKKGRIDIELELDDIGQFVLIELKATNWKKIKPSRIRLTVLRHAKQLERYINATEEWFHKEFPNADIFETSEGIVPAIEYTTPPSEIESKELIENLLNDRGMQVVWREEMNSSQFLIDSDTGTKFVGRQNELIQLQHELIEKNSNLVWISGPGGIGKTTLAMKFANQKQKSFPGGVYDIKATPFETIDQSTQHILANDLLSSLIIIDNVEIRPQDNISQELASIKHLYPNTHIIVTSRNLPPIKGNNFQLGLKGLSKEEFREICKKSFLKINSTQFQALYSIIKGNPLAAQLLVDLISKEDMKLEELIEQLHSFTWPGVVGTHGEILTEQTPEHHRIVSDLITVSDEFLRKLQINPHLLYDLSSRGFEELIAELLDRLDYEVTLTRESKDGGKDIYAAKKNNLGTFLYIVECKKYAPDNHVGLGLVQRLNGVVHAENATAGILATTSFFTRDARAFQRTIPYQLSLKDYVGIQEWLACVMNRNTSEKSIS